MRLLFVADCRSTFAINWINAFVRRGYDVHVISSAPVYGSELGPVASFEVIPIGFSGIASAILKGRSMPELGNSSDLTMMQTWVRRFRYRWVGQLATDIRYLLSNVEVYRHVRRLRQVINRVQPDIVHAMRIPLEAIATVLAIDATPLVTSVWGNDFTLFASRYPSIRRSTVRVLRRTNALHCDCERDVRAARQLGYADDKVTAVLPTNGGVDTKIFRAAPNHAKREITVINPRGFRDYIRNDTFFSAIPMVLREHPDVVFLCSAMQDHPMAIKWVRELGIERAVKLLPFVTHPEMADQFRAADITVSLSEHDGTPNTLLEAMACGCFPIAGELETTREWICDAENGFLCDQGDPTSVAESICRSISQPELRRRATEQNLSMIAERVSVDACTKKIEELYDNVLRRRSDVARLPNGKRSS